MYLPTHTLTHVLTHPLLHFLTAGGGGGQSVKGTIVCSREGEGSATLFVSGTHNPRPSPCPPTLLSFTPRNIQKQSNPSSHPSPRNPPPSNFPILNPPTLKLSFETRQMCPAHQHHRPTFRRPTSVATRNTVVATDRVLSASRGGFDPCSDIYTSTDERT